MKRNLAESKNYKVISEFEMVSLIFKAKDREPVYIGDFYGNPDSAIISNDERFVAIAGCGLIIYNLHEPFDDYFGVANTNQYFVLNNSEPNIWWTSNLHQSLEDVEAKFFRFSIKTNIYRFDTTTNIVEEISV